VKGGTKKTHGFLEETWLFKRLERTPGFRVRANFCVRKNPQREEKMNKKMAKCRAQKLGPKQNTPHTKKNNGGTP